MEGNEPTVWDCILELLAAAQEDWPVLTIPENLYADTFNGRQN